MQNLQIQSPHLITYADEHFTIDVLGGVDTMQIEKMICTLRVIHQNYPPLRSTFDLYSDSQTDKFIRTLCDKYGLALLDRLCKICIKDILKKSLIFAIKIIKYNNL